MNPVLLLFYFHESKTNSFGKLEEEKLGAIYGNLKLECCTKDCIGFKTYTVYS